MRNGLTCALIERVPFKEAGGTKSATQHKAIVGLIGKADVGHPLAVVWLVTGQVAAESGSWGERLWVKMAGDRGSGPVARFKFPVLLLCSTQGSSNS